MANKIKMISLGGLEPKRNVPCAESFLVVKIEGTPYFVTVCRKSDKAFSMDAWDGRPTEDDLHKHWGECAKNNAHTCYDHMTPEAKKWEATKFLSTPHCVNCKNYREEITFPEERPVFDIKHLGKCSLNKELWTKWDNEGCPTWRQFGGSDEE